VGAQEPASGVTVADPVASRRWWVLFAASAAALLAWSFGFPILAGPDEGPHAARAAAAARGQLTGPVVTRVTDQMLVRVPEAYRHFDRAACFQASPFNPRPPDLSARCVPSFRGGWRLVEVGTYEFRGFPLPYAAVGLPTLAAPDRTGMYLMRVVGALVGAALIAGALASTWRSGRAAPPAALGVLVALTPVVWHLGGLVNPNGLEILAAVCLWSSLAALTTADGDRARLVDRAGFALVVLVAARPFGPLVAVVAFAAVTGLATPARRSALHAAARLPRARTWLTLAVAVTVMHGAWLVGYGLRHPTDRPALGLIESLRRWPRLGREAVGLFGANALPAPRAVLWVWAAVTVGVLAAGWWGATRRGRTVLAAVAAVGFVLTTGADGFNLPPIGFDWQGRYGLPLYVGLPILAGHLAASATARRAAAQTARLDRAARVGVVLLAAAQVVAFVAVARRVGMGDPSGWEVLDFVTRPVWSPPLPPALGLAAFTAGMVTLAATVVTRWEPRAR